MSLVDTADILRGFKKKKEFFEIIKKSDFLMFPKYSSGNTINIAFSLGGISIDEDSYLIFSDEIYNPSKKTLLTLAQKISAIALHEEQIIDTMKAFKDKTDSYTASILLKSIVHSANYLNMFPDNYLLKVPSISSKIIVDGIIAGVYKNHYDRNALSQLTNRFWDSNGIYTRNDILSTEPAMIIKFKENVDNSHLIKALDGKDLEIVEYYHEIFPAFHIRGEKYTVISVPKTA